MDKRVAAVFFLAVLIAVLGVSPALAQEESPLRFGVKLGLNISEFRGSDIAGLGELLDWKAGFCGGVFMSYDVNEWFTLQPEILYSMKGMKLGFMDESATVSLDYIDIPILATVKIPVEGTLRPFIYAGPVFGINVRSEASSTLSEDEDSELDLSDYTNGFEFSLALGLGLNIGIAGREMILDFRYEPGLTNVYDTPSDVDQTVEWKNDAIAILFGFRI